MTENSEFVKRKLEQNEITRHLFARKGTRVKVKHRLGTVEGTLTHVDPFLYWLEVEKKTKASSKTVFVCLKNGIEIETIGTDEAVMLKKQNTAR